MACVRRLGIVVTAMFAVLGAGCSVYPLPDDVSRSSTFDIVQRMRCEAKAGLDRFLLSDEHAQAIIAGTTIGYDFNFTIIEDNDAEKGHLDLLRQPQVKGNTKLAVDINGSATRQRENIRSIQFIEDLTELALVQCGPQSVRNGLYPLTGSVGMKL